MKWFLLLAALVLVVLDVAFPDRRNGSESVETAAAELSRGTGLQLAAPVGAVELLREFTWQSPIASDRYRVTVRRGATIVWQSETNALRLPPPPSGTIERDVQYEWRVEALNREGVVQMTSPSQSFVVY